ncbi:hypothetical protein ASF44_07400 [Pseudorhodoferax sp. Leaf274]|nr:hypothetical protein ASF44_07400 [Pseudorhodoferax sp. Leaf274]
MVSFVAMADVSESGRLISHQTRPFERVKTGFTRFQDGDILFAKITPCMENGKGALVHGLEGGVGCGSTEFHVLRAKNGHDARYLHQWLQWGATRDKAKLFMSGSAGQQRVPSDFFRRFRIPAPDGTAQRRIAAILTSLDNAIEATEALIEKNRQIKAGLMQDLFTRGVLSNGQLRPPPAAAAVLYRDWELGFLPKSWNLVKAGALCSLITKGTTPLASEMWQGADGVRFLRVDNLTFDGRLSFAASDFRISGKTHTTTLSRSRCFVGDVLMNIVGPPLGKVGLVEDQSLNINQAIAVFRPSSQVLSRFLLIWLTTDLAKQWILQRAKQTSGQVNVTLAMCQAIPVPLPDLAEQERIIERFASVELRLRAEADQLDKLRFKKLGLMQDLLTGEVLVTVPAPANAA